MTDIVHTSRTIQTFTLAGTGNGALIEVSVVPRGLVGLSCGAQSLCARMRWMRYRRAIDNPRRASFTPPGPFKCTTKDARAIQPSSRSRASLAVPLGCFGLYTRCMCIPGGHGARISPNTRDGHRSHYVHTSRIIQTRTLAGTGDGAVIEVSRAHRVDIGL